MSNFSQSASCEIEIFFLYFAIDGAYKKLIKLPHLVGEGVCLRNGKNKKQKERSDGNLCW